MWDFESGSEKDEETDVSACCDANTNITQKGFEQLFGEFDDNPILKGFKVVNIVGNCVYTG